MNKSQKRKLHDYIRKTLHQGHTLNEIKLAFLNRGYDESSTDKVLRNFKIKETLTRASPLLLVLLLFIPLLFFYSSNITSFTFFTKQYNFTDEIDLTFNEHSEYVWELENKGILKSVKLNGEVKTSGTVKVYLAYGNTTYLIFDSKLLEGKSALESVTGYAVNDNNNSNRPNTPPIWTNSSDKFIVNGTLILDLNDYFYDRDDDILTYSATEQQGNDLEILLEDSILTINNKNNAEGNKVLELIANDNLTSKKKNVVLFLVKLDINDAITNQTINVTPPTNQTINITPDVNDTEDNISTNEIKIILEYKQDSIYDKNDDGVENINRIIDLTVENTQFNFDVNEENLCTVWDTFSKENEEGAFVCYGSFRCCQFVDLVPSRPVWDDIFYSSYGQYGATFDNIISSQVLYVDYNLSLENPYSEIYSSEWKNLTTEFYDDHIIFENICVETCILPDINESSYKLIIEADGSEIILESISYLMEVNQIKNNPPVLLNNFTDISIFRDQSHTINLNDYFHDADNDTLIFEAFNNSDIEVSIINGTATLKAVNFTGKTHMFFMAADSKDEVISNIFEIKVKKRIFDIKGLKSLRELIGLI